tara:strand:- start:3490 stop:3990 length:501 start_codon:yes stop_codon:yes gene_type:complete
MGCGCGSNFSGKSNFVKKEKPCTCGRNKGGNCQCNNKQLNAIGNFSTNVTSPPLNAKDTGKPCSCNCKSCADSGHASTACNCGSGKCCGGQGGAKIKNIKRSRNKFSGFMGKDLPKFKKQPIVDTKKHNILPEHVFEYNKRQFDIPRKTSDSFKNYNDLNAMNYEF